ncbi:MAG: GPW/gp25 family protein [Massilia sp.]
MDDRKQFLGRGWAFPVQLDMATGRVADAAYEDDIRQAIRIIIETAPGERVMRPDFGCGVHALVFEATDTTLLQRVRSEVEAALTRYEARIELTSIGVAAGPDSDGQLLIELEYRVRLTNQVGNLVYPFYFREGGQR